MTSVHETPGGNLYLPYRGGDPLQSQSKTAAVSAVTEFNLNYSLEMDSVSLTTADGGSVTGSLIHMRLEASSMQQVQAYVQSGRRYSAVDYSMQTGMALDVTMVWLEATASPSSSDAVSDSARDLVDGFEETVASDGNPPAETVVQAVDADGSKPAEVVDQTVDADGNQPVDAAVVDAAPQEEPVADDTAAPAETVPGNAQQFAETLDKFMQTLAEATGMDPSTFNDLSRMIKESMGAFLDQGSTTGSDGSTVVSVSQFRAAFSSTIGHTLLIADEKPLAHGFYRSAMRFHGHGSRHHSLRDPEKSVRDMMGGDSVRPEHLKRKLLAAFGNRSLSPMERLLSLDVGRGGRSPQVTEAA